MAKARRAARPAGRRLVSAKSPHRTRHADLISRATARRGTRLVRAAVLFLTAAGALSGWIHLERTEEVGPSVACYGGSLLAGVVLIALVGCLSEPDGISATLGRGLAVRRSQRFRDQFAAWGAPGAAIWLLPYGLAPLMIATLPIAYHTSPGDNSIWAVLAAYLFLLAPVALLAGLLSWMMIVFPLLLLFRSLGRVISRHRAADEDLLAIGLAGLLIFIVVFAVTLVLSAPSTSGPGRHSTRPDQWHQFRALIGAGNQYVQHSVLLWTARAAVVLIIASGILTARMMTRRKPTSAPGH